MPADMKKALNHAYMVPDLEVSLDKGQYFRYLYRSTEHCQAEK